MSATEITTANLPTDSYQHNDAATRFSRDGKDYILFVKLEQDQDAEGPRDHADKHAFLVYGHRDFTVKGPNNEEAIEVHKAKSKWQRHHWVWPVYAYIHSGVHLQLGTDAGLPDRQWDVSMCGYCVVTRSKKEIPDPRKYAEGMIEEWNQYLSGDVYGYDIALYKLQRDEDGEPIEERDYYERHAKVLDSDSCWGFYGWEYALDEAKSSAEQAISALDGATSNTEVTSEVS